MEKWNSGARPRVVDVRTPGEYRRVHIPMAELIPLGNLNERTIREQKLTDEPVYVICKAGSRSQKAAEKLASAGAKEVWNISGGTDKWAAEDLPVVRSEACGLTLLRQTQLGIGLVILVFALLAIFVDPRYAVVCAAFGAGLMFAGATGWCGFAIVLAYMPWNRGKSTGKSCAV